MTEPGGGPRDAIVGAGAPSGASPARPRRVRHGKGFTFEVVADGERLRLPAAARTLDTFHCVVDQAGRVEMRYGRPGAGRPDVRGETVVAWVRVPAGTKDCGSVEIVED